jgi:hypothetical protein
VYDIETDIENITINMELENDFSLEIPFKNIPNQKKLASIRFDYYLPNGEKRYGYITENQFINYKESEIPNQIEIKFIEKPKEELINRVTKATLIDDRIKIISTQMNKSDLPDYMTKIEFKDVY